MYLVYRLIKYIDLLIYRRPTHGVHGKSDNRGRGRFNNQEGDGWGKKSLVSEPTSVVSTANVKVHSNDRVHDNIASMEAIEKPGSYPQARREDDLLTPMADPNDSEAQVICVLFLWLFVMHQKLETYIFPHLISVLR